MGLIFGGLACTNSFPNQPPPTAKTLDIPYIHQTYDAPDDFVGTWACAPASALMVLAYYGRIPPSPITVSRPLLHASDYGAYISREYAYNGRVFSTVSSVHIEAAGGETAIGQGAWGYIWKDSTSSRVLNLVIENLLEYLRLHDFIVSYAHYDENSATDLVRQEIDSGRPLIARTLLTPGGHYVVVVGYEIDKEGHFWYKVNDPFGDKPYDDSRWGDYDTQQPVTYSYSQMGLGNSTRGLIIIRPETISVREG